MGRFFEIYKELERVLTEVAGWERADAAPAKIMYATELFKEKFGEPEVES
jgi:inorganic pyrophosphatase